MSQYMEYVRDREDGGFELCDYAGHVLFAVSADGKDEINPVTGEEECAPSSDADVPF